MILGHLSNFLRFPTRLEYAAVQVADDSLTEVWDRVSHRAPELSANEARGYIRARAAVVVHRNVNSVLQDAPAHMKNKLTELTMDRLIDSLLQRSRSVVVAPLRRAA